MAMHSSLSNAKPTLEPCHKCGKMPFLSKRSGIGYLSGRYVRCRKCACLVTSRTPDGAVNTWNRRQKDAAGE